MSADINQYLKLQTAMLKETGFTQFPYIIEVFSLLLQVSADLQASRRVKS